MSAILKDGKSLAKLTEKGISLKVHPMQPEPNLSKVGLLSKVNTSFQEVRNFHSASQMLLLNTAAIGRMISVTSTDFNHQTFNNHGYFQRSNQSQRLLLQLQRVQMYLHLWRKPWPTHLEQVCRKTQTGFHSVVLRP